MGRRSDLTEDGPLTLSCGKSGQVLADLLLI